MRSMIRIIDIDISEFVPMISRPGHPDDAIAY